MTIKKSSGSGIPSGLNAGRPANPAYGQLYSNGETNRLELYTQASGWQNIVQETPGVASITGTYLESANSGTITIAGTNFVSGAIASAIGTNGVEVIASSTTYNSLVQLTAVFTGLSNANEPYNIKVTNPSNLFGLLPNALYVNASPVWQTASGSLGTFIEQVSISVSAIATDETAITYALASGSTLPSGISLNSSTGVISGTLPNISSNTTYNFTINASDGTNSIVPRSFSITANAYADVQYVIVAGGGGGAGGQPGLGVGGGGGAGGYRSSVIGENTGGGLSAETLFSAIPGTAYTVTVGNGGSGASGGNLPSNGENSIFGSIVALGGGFGGRPSADTPRTVGSGGSGGGVGQSGTGTGTGTSGQGYNGGSPNGVNSAGGGGGAGAQGLDGASGTGGVGVASSITGSSIFRAGGGGGGRHIAQGGTASGGNGGGGNSGPTNGNGVSGSTNTGGGGGGGGESGGTFSGGNGGSGVVIIKYANTLSPTISGGLTSSTSTAVLGFKITTFTAGSGTITF